MNSKIEAFLIRCTTGCSCCRRDNETHGPWRTLEAARDQAQRYEGYALLSSQYAPRGLYEIIRVEAEELPDGRLILDGRLIALGFIDIDDGIPNDVPLLRAEQMDLIEGTRIEQIGKTQL